MSDFTELYSAEDDGGNDDVNCLNESSHDDERFTKGKVSFGHLSSGRSILTVISFKHKQEIVLEDDQGKFTIPPGTDFRTTDDESDIKTLQRCLRLYVNNYMDFTSTTKESAKGSNNNNEGEEEEEEEDLSAEEWSQTVLDNADSVASSLLHSKDRLLIAASRTHDINIQVYLHEALSYRFVCPENNNHSTVLLTQWFIGDGHDIHFDLRYTIGFIDWDKVFWKLDTLKFKPTDENMEFLKGILEKYRNSGEDTCINSHMKGAFSIKPLHICLEKDALYRIVGRYLPAFLQLMQKKNFQSETMTDDELRVVEVASVGNDFNMKTALATLASNPEPPESTVVDLNSGEVFQFNDPHVTGIYLRTSTKLVGQRRKEYTDFLKGCELLGDEYSSLISFAKGWLAMHEHTPEDQWDTIIYVGMTAGQSIWSRQQAENDPNKPDGALLNWGHTNRFRVDRMIGVAYAEPGNKSESLFLEGLTMGALQWSANEPINLIASNYNALNQANTGLVWFLRQGGMSTMLRVAWFKSNTSLGREKVVTSSNVPKGIKHYTSYWKDDILQYVNVAMVHSYMASRGGGIKGKCLSDVTIEARNYISNLSSEDINTKPNSVYQNIKDILTVGTEDKNRSCLQIRLKRFFECLKRDYGDKYNDINEEYRTDHQSEMDKGKVKTTNEIQKKSEEAKKGADDLDALFASSWNNNNNNNNNSNSNNEPNSANNGDNENNSDGDGNGSSSNSNSSDIEEDNNDDSSSSDDEVVAPSKSVGKRKFIKEESDSD